MKLTNEREEAASYHKFWIEERDKRIGLERELAEAVEVLRPFAVEADVWPSNYNDDDELVEPFGDYSGELNVGALRAARQFVKEHGKP